MSLSLSACWSTPGVFKVFETPPTATTSLSYSTLNDSDDPTVAAIDIRKEKSIGFAGTHLYM